MLRKIVTILTVLIIIALSVLSLIFGNIHLSENQLITLMIVGIICASSVLYCFVVGEITKNYSQMDKLWSLLPIAYAWVIAARGNYRLRLVIIAIIVSLWGIRLTYNFARKGAYKLKFWEGEEDYRWSIVREKFFHNNKTLWSLFDLFFISLYQNVLVLAITLPELAVMDSDIALGVMDFVGFGLAIFFLLLETVSDSYMWKFQQKKKALLKEGKKIEELEYPYNLGYNTLGVWAFMRHPNYLGEQGIWLSLYLCVIGGGATNYAIFNWSIIGPLFLIMLFAGSSSLAEDISSSKYPRYKDYQEQVFKYLPLRKFKNKEN